MAAVTAVGGLLVGAPLTWLVPAALAAFAGWIAGAWDEGQRWTWWAVMALITLSAGSDLHGLAAGPSWWRAAWLLFDAVFVALLAHPDSTATLEPRVRPARAPQWVPERPPRG